MTCRYETLLYVVVHVQILGKSFMSGSWTFVCRNLFPTSSHGLSAFLLLTRDVAFQQHGRVHGRALATRVLQDLARPESLDALRWFLVAPITIMLLTSTMALEHTFQQEFRLLRLQLQVNLAVAVTLTETLGVAAKLHGRFRFCLSGFLHSNGPVGSLCFFPTLTFPRPASAQWWPRLS